MLMVKEAPSSTALITKQLIYRPYRPYRPPWQEMSDGWRPIS